MKRFVIATVLAASALAAFALSAAKIGGIDYAEGGISISRNGKISRPRISATPFSQATSSRPSPTA